MNIAVVSDTNTGFTPEEVKELGIDLVQMPFMINEEVRYEYINFTHEEFFATLADKDAAISTSQAPLADVTDLWDRLLETHDAVVHIPTSSKLSGACSTAMTLSEDYDGRVQVVDNHRISVLLQQATKDALMLTKKGLTAEQIKARLEETQYDCTAYIMVDTMKYLKKGGRITAAAAAVGTVLNIKPILSLQGGQLDAFAKPRGQKAAKQTMLEAVRKDIDERLADKEGHIVLHVVHANCLEEAKAFRAEVEEAFPGVPVSIAPLSLSVSCHTGPGALALAATVALEA
ncbi:MAG: DegV family protein [Clostridia bacterium]|nr:DegV family protein [Clostridia bacterium]